MSDRERILDLEAAVAKLISDVGRLWELLGERSGAAGAGTDTKDLILRALRTNGAHHKQWYLERLADLLGLDLDPLRDGYDEGIAP